MKLKVNLEILAACNGMKLSQLAIKLAYAARTSLPSRIAAPVLR